MRVKLENKKGDLLCMEQTKIEQEAYCQRRNLSLNVKQQPIGELSTEGGYHF